MYFCQEGFAINIAFFLIPKKEVVYLPLKCTMRQALEKMEYHRYTALPLIDSEGKYAGTLTEGDLLWKLKNTPGLTFEGTEKVYLKDVSRRTINMPVQIDSKISDLISLAVDQNFVPVVDDNSIFIGIIRRREIIEYCAEILASAGEMESVQSYTGEGKNVDTNRS